MDFQKNETLILNICHVQIKSISEAVSIPDFKDIYSTPSKITLSKSSSLSDDGVVHKKQLTLSYPGLSSADFDKFNELIKGEYIILAKTDTGDIYQLCTERYPMQCNTRFSNNHTINFTGDSPINIKFIENQEGIGIDSDGFQYDFNFFLS